MSSQAIRVAHESDILLISQSENISSGDPLFRTHMLLNSLAHTAAIIFLSLAAFPHTLTVSRLTIIIMQS